MAKFSHFGSKKRVSTAKISGNFSWYFNRQNDENHVILMEIPEILGISQNFAQNFSREFFRACAKLRCATQLSALRAHSHARIPTPRLKVEVWRNSRSGSEPAMAPPHLDLKVEVWDSL